MIDEGDEGFTVGFEAGDFAFEFVIDPGEGGTGGDGVDLGKGGG